MSSPLSANLESILDRFDDAWNSPTPPRIEDYLTMTEPAKRLALLTELVHIDLERRLARGERIRLEETYLPRFPELKADRSSIVFLAGREFELRRRREPDLSPEEYLERWPQYRDELAQLLGSRPTLSTDGETCDGKPHKDGRKATEETRDVFAFLSPPQAPDELGRLRSYRILEVLGSGGMGVVFLAEDSQLKRPVALKVMRPGMAANQSARKRFLREARAMAALKHDRIVTIYQVDEDRGVPFLAMEHLQGETLHARLKRETLLPLDEALRISGEIAAALSAAHAHGLIHRDIKPANIWLEFSRDPKGSANAPANALAYGSRLNETVRVKLLDFGLARPAGGDDAHLTQTGVILGTPAFMSPEQARGEHVDPRSDLFSLGCVLYRMVTGHLPFQGRAMVSTLLSLAHDHPKPPRELNPNVPPALNRLIQRLLAKNVADRPSSAEAVVKALETLDNEPEPAPLPQPAPTRRRRVPIAMAALALLGMSALMAGIIIRIRSKDGRETIIEVPEGSTVMIEEKANPSRDRQGAVAPPNPSRDRQGAVVPPLAEGSEALSPWALVRSPARIKGMRSWTIDTRSLHGGSISCAMRPDGRALAVGGFDGVIRLYDPSTGQLQQALFGQQTDTSKCNLTWSPDGKRLASCFLKGPLHIWNAATGQLIRTIPPNSAESYCVAWSPDGKLLAFGTTSGVTLWNPDSGKQVSFPAEAGSVKTLTWSPDSKMLAAAFADKIVRLWEVPSGKLLHKFEGCAEWLPSLALSPDGTTLVFAASDKELCIYDVHSGKLLRRLEPDRIGANQIRNAAFSPDGKTLAVGMCFWAGVLLFDTESWKALRWLDCRGYGEVRSVSWSPQGAVLTALTDVIEGYVNIFDVKTGKELRRIEMHPRMEYFAWSADGKKIAATLAENSGWWRGIRIWDAVSGTQLQRIESARGGLSWSPRGSSLAVLEGNQVHVLNGEARQRLRSWNAPVFAERYPVWSPDGKLLATVGNDKTVQIWAAASGRLVHTLKGHTADANVLAWSPDGKLIASGSAGDKTVRLWDASSGKQVHSFDADDCIRLAWSPDGQSLASGTPGDTRTWDMATKELQIRCEGPLLGWSADSKAVMTEGGETVRWWDRQTGELLRRKEFPLMEWPILSPDSQLVAVPRAGALYIGDISRGKFDLTLVPLRGGQWLAVRPDGHYRGSPGVEKEIVYIVQTDAGQELLAPDEFAKKYGWKNNPECVRLTVP